MSYFTTAKIINMAVIITVAMARQREARSGFLVRVDGGKKSEETVI
jgi:hypothetical protein